MKVSLHTSAHPASVLDAVFLPWLKNAALNIARERRATAVLVPFRSHAYFLKARARGAAPHFAALFIAGFDAQHWPLWPLLAAAAHAAESATVMLSDPRPEAEALDAAWIGTWEETFGSAAQVPAEPAPPTAAFTFL